ncbi:MAG TPA: hypothetical protein VK099_00325 [Alcanivoracaceae bacterium]|nr:hypothetical protein [Alcanivoracaceae bacterium]
MTETTSIAWSIDVLEGWEPDELGDVAVFTRPDGVGVLQAVSYEQDEEVTEEDLTDLAQEHVEAGHESSKVNVGDFEGITYTLREEGEFWQFWYLAGDRLAVVFTYSCADEDRNIEIDEVREMVNSIILEFIDEEE